MDFSLILSAHRGFAYLILLATTIFVITLLVTMFSQSGRLAKPLRLSTLITMILFHLQALIGLVLLFFFSPGFRAARESGELMKNADYRHTYVEHPVAMVLAAILLTIFNRKIKAGDRLQPSWMFMAVVAVALMLYAFQWQRAFGG